MNLKRVNELLKSIRGSLTQPDPKTINIFDFFELIEHVTRDYIGDTSKVTSLNPLENVKTIEMPKPKEKNVRRKKRTA